MIGKVASADDLAALVAAVGRMPDADDDAERIDRIRQFEVLKSAIAAAQIREAVEFDRSQRATQAAGRVPAAQQGRGVAAQVALARRVSPWQAQRWLGWAKILTTELPSTYAALRAGHTSEWRAMVVARETAPLVVEHRAAVDGELAPRLAGWGDRQVEAEVRKAVYRLDPAGAVDRARNAASDRRVTIRPAPDTMTRLSVLVPVQQGVATYAALRREADSVTFSGDGRSRGQIMADTLVERVTGQSAATDVPVEIELLITAAALNGDGSDGGHAHVVGYGPIPSDIAREIATGRENDPSPRWIRRVFSDPDSGRLVALDSRRREFTDAQRRFLRLRDQVCRTPWCGAPIRHADHVVAHDAGGPTAVDNGQGLCEACNYAKQAPGWSADVDVGGEITTHTPTGHVYRSREPDPPDVRRDLARLRRLRASGRLAA